MRSNSIRILGIAAMLATVVLSGCETIGYYSQAASGQLYILTHRQSIHAMLASEDTGGLLRSRLAAVEAIRQFALQELALPLGKQYSTYVDVGRPYVVWNVFAAPEFSTQPKTWCYPIAGCVSYRGYFSEQAANAFAGKTAAEGYEVYVGGVAAYSTLGWFSDPVLNTVIQRDTHQLAALIFHELAHQVVYFPGDTEFNESFATTVERLGMQRWLETAIDNDAERERILEQANQDIQRQSDFIALVTAAVADLQDIYDSGLPDSEMRVAKASRLAQLREQYVLQKTAWGGYAGYDDWFSRDLNNAQLSTVTTYNNLVPELMTLFTAAGEDFEAFYRAAAALGEQRNAE
jgi:predicted aminopeptidase